jgi:polyvinyl alcohol dehydrogenase (cytochrome)
MRFAVLFAAAFALHAQDSSPCSDCAVKFPQRSKGAWNGWSPSLTNTRFQTANTAGLTLDQVRKLRLKWAFGFDGDMIVFSLPSVIGNNIFVGSASGLVHALDARSGCEHWSFKADDGVRTATVLSGKSLLFGDRGG